MTTDKYIIPKDGYIYVSCSINTSIGTTFINVGIYDAKDTQICAISAISNGTYSSSDTLFVKKGMSTRILDDYGSTYARFIPLE